MPNICRSLQKKFFFSPIPKSPTHIGFIGVKKNGSKISHLGTFKFNSYSQFEFQLTPIEKFQCELKLYRKMNQRHFFYTI